MQLGKVLMVSVAFLFYVFYFQELVVAIDGLSPSLPLFPVFRLIPYTVALVMLGLLAYFGFAGDNE